MSLKQELQTWSDALKAYDAQDWDTCLDLFDTIADSSKILFNIGIIQATTGDHANAVESFRAAHGQDQYLAVAYFQEGVSNFLLESYEEAYNNFSDAFDYMRSNSTIDYEQLGLKFRLYSCEILFNRGLASIYLGNQDDGMKDLRDASKEKQTDEHTVIDEAIRDGGDGYTVFSIPVGVIYRPSESKLKNLASKNYLGTSKLVAATDASDAFTGFTGTVRANRAKDRDQGKADEVKALIGRSNTTSRRDDTAGEVKPLLRRNNTVGGGGGGRGGGDGGGGEAGPTLPGGVGIRGRSNSARQPPQGPSKNDNTSLPSPPASEELARSKNLPPTKLRSNANPPPGDSRPASSAYPETDFVDSYYVDDDAPPMPPMPPTLPLAANRDGPVPQGQPLDRVANWARQASAAERMGGGGGSNGTLSRQPSFSRSPNQGGAPLMRTISKSTRGGYGMSGNGAAAPRGFVMSPRSGGAYDDDDGQYSQTLMTEVEMNKIRQSIAPDLQLEDFTERVRVKFASKFDLPMKYKDAEGEMVSIIDSDDWESAVDEAREAAKGRAEGKLEIFIA